MRVILLENIKGFGQMGDVRNVADGYARNFLFPRKMAKLATDAALKEVDSLKKKLETAQTLEKEGTAKLAEQLKDVLEKVSLSDNWADKMLAQIEQDKNITAQSNSALVQSIKDEVETIDQKLDKLLDSHLDGLIEKQTYLKKKEILINRKLVLEDRNKELLKFRALKECNHQNSPFQQN